MIYTHFIISKVVTSFVYVNQITQTIPVTLVRYQKINVYMKLFWQCHRL